MDNKYINYSVEDFAQDLNFIKWVSNGTGHKDWVNFIHQNPDMVKDIESAKQIVNAFGYGSHDLQEGEIFESYENIITLFTEQHKLKPTFRFRKFMQYAALFALILLIGAAIPYIYSYMNSDKYVEIASASSTNNEAKLILPGGEEILLNKEQSDLQFNSTGSQIKINKDSIINFNKPNEQNAMAQVVIPYGKRSSLLLSDGTKVWLNAGSKLIFPQKFTGKERKVILKGEAYFDVFKNKEIPFIVSTDKMNVTVHGTEFNVRDNDSDNELEVVLVEGAVSLKENSVMNILSNEIKLKPNQKAVFSKADDKTSIESNIDVAQYISWKEGLLEFDRENILSVFKKLSRFYNISFVAQSSVELNNKISGKLDLKESLQDVLKVISDVAPVSFRIENDKVFVDTRLNYLPMR